MQTKAKPEYAKCFPYLLKLLAYLMNPEKQLPDCKDVNWQAFLALSEFHSLAGMLSYAVCALPEEQRPQNETFEVFRQHQALSLVTDSNVTLETEKLLRALSDAGVRVIPVKGYVLKNDYPIPSMRTMTDVDIIYDSTMKQTVKSVFGDFGYTCDETGSELNFNKEPFYHYELHSDKKKNHVYFDNVLSRGVYKKDSLAGFLNTEDSYLFMLSHLSKHFIYGGAGVRMVTDVYVFCSKYYEKMDKAYLAKELETLGLAKFEMKIRELAYDWFSQENPSTDTLLADYILCACTFGNVRDSFISNAIISEKKSGKKQTITKVILNKIFVPYNHIAELYPSSKKHKVLYPFCLYALWFERIFKKRNLNTENLKYYAISTESEDTKRLQLVMQEAGISFDRKAT